MTRGLAQGLVLRNWDKIQAARIGSWNEEMAIYLARQILVAPASSPFAEVKTTDNPALGPPIKEKVIDEDAPRLVRLARASDLVQAQAEAISEAYKFVSTHAKANHDFRSRRWFVLDHCKFPLTALKLFTQGFLTRI